MRMVIGGIAVIVIVIAIACHIAMYFMQPKKTETHKKAADVETHMPHLDAHKRVTHIVADSIHHEDVKEQTHEHVTPHHPKSAHSASSVDGSDEHTTHTRV